MIVDSKIKMMN